MSLMRKDKQGKKRANSTRSAARGSNHPGTLDMNRPEPTRTGSSLQSLKAMFAERYERLPACRAPAYPGRPMEPRRFGEECRLFREAMADVRPLGGNRRLPPPVNRPPPLVEAVADPDGRDRLHSLIAQGVGFVVALTPEYMEGAGRDVPQSILRRLHRGDFSIQGYIDMHGLTLRQARPVFDGFLSEALATGKRAVLIVHGRGLSSPRAPVLKTRVAAWLSSGPWQKWVIAFASARPCDGGAGATYVLLRQRPKARRRPENKSARQLPGPQGGSSLPVRSRAGRR